MLITYAIARCYANGNGNGSGSGSGSDSGSSSDNGSGSGIMKMVKVFHVDKQAGTTRPANPIRNRTAS